MANRTIEIVVNLRDNTNAKLESLKKSLDAMDKQAQRLNNRFKSFATQRYMATLRLIDNVTAPASRIQRLLQTIAGKAYNISMKVSDGALASVRKIEGALQRIVGKVYPITLAVKGNVMSKLNGLMSGAAMGAGMFMPVAGMAGVGFGVANAIQSSMGFEQEMSRVQAIRQLSKDSQDMKDMYALAKKLGMETAWTRQQVGEAMRYQALAGWETPQILKATPHMLNLASAGGMDLGAASDMLTDAMTAFGLKATDRYINAKGQAIDLPEYFADMFAKVQASSNTDLYQLKEATKYSASTIGTMFANVEGQEGTQLRTEAARQMLIMAGLMANAGIKGSMAGTGINTIFNRLAGENRNTHFAEKLLGLEHAAANGNMIMPLDFIKAFRNKIQGGMSVDDFLQVAEELSGERISADTRRKINSTIESALKNGGKLGSSEMLKIGSMMAGLENAPKLMAMVFQDIEALEAKINNVEGTAGQMAETMLDNLAGSFTKLGSAWDAFQQDLFTGTAGDSLRGLVDTMTEILTRANKLFKDGIDIGDFGQIIADVISRLKNKFLELDGIGSILAGGALVAGLMKIISLSQRAFTALKTVTQPGAWSTVGAKGTGGAGLGAGAKVGTMTVSAGVVNVNGKVAGGGGAGGAGNRRVGNTAIIDNYNRTKEQIRGTGVPPVPPVATSRLANFSSAAAGGAIFAGIFGALDMMNVRAANAERLAAAATAEERATVMKENRKIEMEAGGGALGSIVGSAIGAGLGSLAGPLGTAIGGVVGGMLGDVVGRIFGKEVGEDTNAPPTTQDYFGFNKANNDVPAPSSWADFRREQEKQQQAVHASVAEFSKLNDATQTQINRFQKIDEKLGAFSPFQHDAAINATQDYYRQQAQNLGEADVKPLSALSEMLENLFFSRTAAAELTPEQMAQQAAMEQGTFYPAGEMTTPGEPPEVPDMSAFVEQFYSEMEALQEGVGELFSGFGEQITEQLTAAFEGAGEVFSTFGTTITEGLTATFEGAGEMFTGFGEQLTASMTAAQESATASMTAIQTTFTTTKDTVQTSWAELPGFFSGVFSGLGGAAEAAGAAIHAGLTAPIGSVIGAWQSAAATISSIISSISAQAAAMPSVPSGGGVPAHAEGGFISRPEVALIGERGAEVVIPLNGSQRALDLYKQTGEVLGISDEFGDSTISGSSSGSNSGSGGVSIGNVNVNLEISGVENAQDFVQKVREHAQEIGDIMAASLSEAVATVHKNQTLVA